MKAAEVRKLIGHEVEWEYAHDHRRGTFLVRKGVVKEVQGRNVLIDVQGSDDWKWLPDLVNLKCLAR